MWLSVKSYVIFETFYESEVLKTIGGNVTAVLQTKTSSKNAFGEKVETWNDVQLLKGFLDFTGGDGSYKSNFKGAVEETTHIFICDYDNVASQATPTQCRLACDNKMYDVLMIDNPMGLNQHLEIMLKYNEVIK